MKPVSLSAQIFMLVCAFAGAFALGPVDSYQWRIEPASDL
jgi:hypothetical protein